MSYIYTGHVELNEADEDTILGFLLVAHLYGFEQLLTPISEHLQQRLSIQNVCRIFSRTLHLELKPLEDASYRWLEENPRETLDGKNFCHLSEAALCRLLSRDSFCAKEIEIFHAVVQWCKQRPDGTSLSSEVLKSIRLPLIATTDLVTTVMDSGLVSKDRLWEAIRIKKSSIEALSYRGKLIPNENLASAAHGAVLLGDQCGENIVTTKTCEAYQSAPMPARFHVDKAMCLVVALGGPVLINHVSFRVVQWGECSCSYILAISMEPDKSIVVINHSDRKCISLQKLYFKPRVARFLHIRFTRTSCAFDFTDFEVYYTTKPGKNIGCVEAPVKR